MGFFDSLGSFLGGVGGIASVAAPIIGGLKSRPKDAPATAQLGADTQQANQMAAAAVNPNDPMYRNLLRLEEEKGRVDIARAVNEHLRQRKNMVRRLGSNRYSALFNPEREDEGMSRAIAQEGAASGERARATTRDTLLAGAGRIQGGLSATAAQAGLQNQQNAAKNQSTANIYNAVGQFGGNLANNDWLKALQKQLQYNETYGAPGGYSYFGGPR